MVQILHGYFLEGLQVEHFEIILQLLLAAVFVLDPLALLLTADVDTFLLDQQHLLQVKELALQQLGVFLLEVTLHLHQIPDFEHVQLAFIGEALRIEAPFERWDVLEPVLKACFELGGVFKHHE